MTYTSKRKTRYGRQAAAKHAQARSEVASLTADQLKKAGVDVSKGPHPPTFPVDARTMTALMSLR